MPAYAKRLKVHLLLHLPEDILEFGSPACFNTHSERLAFEAQNEYAIHVISCI